MKRQRKQEQTPNPRTIIVGWKCPVCKVTSSGFIPIGNHTLRYCQAPSNRDERRPGDICGGILAEVHRGWAA